MKGILPTREDHIAFWQNKADNKLIYPQSYQEHSYTSHEHHKQGHNLISSISWWSKYMREAHLRDIYYKCSLWYKDANMIWYIYGNATCICTSTLPTEAQKGKITPSYPRKRANVAWSKGLVRISASCFYVGTWMRSMFPFSTLSLRKWYLASMCLVLEWSTGFLATLMALMLSHMRGTWEHSSPKSLSVYVIQSSCEQQLAAATYSASMVDWATLDCLREDQETSVEPKNWQVPEVDFLSTRHPVKSASENPRREREEDVEYQRPSSGVYWRYLKIRLTAYWCEVLSDA
jgi:hypothetical protein